MKNMKKTSSRRRRRVLTITMFEQLPPEIFFDIFDYLSGNHIFKSFFDLNRRFKELVYSKPNIHLDLSRTKTKLFRTFLRVFRPQNIVSIVLSYENVNLLETIFNSIGETRFKSLSLLAVSLHAFESRMPEILSTYKYQLISLKIYFTDMHFTGTGAHAAQSFGYLLTELPLLRYLTLEYPQGIDSITYMPSTVINSTIVSLTISLHGERRLIPLLYRFQNLKVLTIHYDSTRMKGTMPTDAIVSYRSQLREKTSIDYPIKVRRINIYDYELVLERVEQLFQIIISPTLLTLSLFTNKRLFQRHMMPRRQLPFVNGTQWHDFLEQHLPLTMKKFHIEYEDVDNPVSMGNLVWVKKEFIKHSGLSSSWKVSCSYKQDKKLLSFDLVSV